MGRASKDKRDIYYRKAKEEGYRARSAYKLLQIDEELDLFKGVHKAVDLCAAPGSWSQVLSSKLGGKEGCRIVAVDLQEMAPLQHVDIVQGDITTESTAATVIEKLGQDMADLVVCDGAPDVTGLHELDEFLQHQLVLAALNITTFVLKPGGHFVAKMFRGPNTDFLVAKGEIFFRNVLIVKPKSSRNASMESFLVCLDYKPPDGFTPTMIHPVGSLDVSQEEPQQQRIVKFLSCGDLSGFDADMSYDRDPCTESLLPTHPPTQTPYLHALLERKRLREESVVVPIVE